MNIKFNTYEDYGYVEEVTVVDKTTVKQLINSWKGCVSDNTRVDHWKEGNVLTFSKSYTNHSAYDCTGDVVSEYLQIQKVFTGFYAINIATSYDV